VRWGLRALPETCAAILVVLGDQPDLTAELIARLIQAYCAARPGIVVPTYRGQRGHPLLFDSRYREEILTGYDHVGLRGLLLAHPEAVVELAVESPGILEDVDVPEDYRRIIGRGSRP
jgi:molybdenum cofactor cytidylyltransferase